MMKAIYEVTKKTADGPELSQEILTRFYLFTLWDSLVNLKIFGQVQTI